MDLLFAALGHPARLGISEHLLGSDEDPPVGPRSTTHAAMRERLGINGGTLTKDLRRLREAQLVTTEPGPRKDQPMYKLRQPERLLTLLRYAAELDAAIGEELALFYGIEADVKSDVAQRLAQRDAGESA